MDAASLAALATQPGTDLPALLQAFILPQVRLMSPEQRAALRAALIDLLAELPPA